MLVVHIAFECAPIYKTGGLGDVVGSLPKVLEKEGKDCVIEAICAPKENISSAYVERFGFIINGIHANYNDTGEPMLKIERNSGAGYYYSDYSDGEIIKEHESNFSVEETHLKKIK